MYINMPTMSTWIYHGYTMFKIYICVIGTATCIWSNQQCLYLGYILKVSESVYVWNCDIYLMLSTQFIPRVLDVKDKHCAYVELQCGPGVIKHYIPWNIALVSSPEPKALGELIVWDSSRRPSARVSFHTFKH